VFLIGRGANPDARRKMGMAANRDAEPLFSGALQRLALRPPLRGPLLRDPRRRRLLARGTRLYHFVRGALVGLWGSPLH
jgi:hypothetical protein